MEDNIVTKIGFINIQVCSTQSLEEALDWVRRDSPAGTQNNWQVDDRKEVAPVKCAEYPERTHYVFTC